MIRFVYVSHGRVAAKNTRTDFDALSSIAIMWRGALRRGLVRGEDFEIKLLDYYNEGLDVLSEFRGASVFIADVPPNALFDINDAESVRRFRSTIRRLSESGIRLNFIDHHPLLDGTTELFESFVREGLIDCARLSGMDHELDRTRSFAQKSCAAEMIRDFLAHRFNMAPDAITRKIADYAHDQDFGIREIADANQLSTLIGADFEPLRIAEALASGEFWSDEMEKEYREALERIRIAIEKLVYEERRWKLREGRIIPVTYALLPANDALRVTVAGVHCLDNRLADVAVLVSRTAFLSMRVRKEVTEIHAGRMLATLGGGGHAGAASAGGRGKWFPYRDADEKSFGDAVTRIDAALTMAARVQTV